MPEKVAQSSQSLTFIYDLSQGKFGVFAHHFLAIRGPEVIGEAARRRLARPEIRRAARGYGKAINVYIPNE